MNATRLVVGILVYIGLSLVLFWTHYINRLVTKILVWSGATLVLMILRGIL